MSRTVGSIPRWFTQASAIASLGVAAAACSGTTDVSPAPTDQGAPDATSEEPVAYYGPAQVDSGAPDAADDEPMVYYGPVPVDASDEMPAAYYGPPPVPGH